MDVTLRIYKCFKETIFTALFVLVLFKANAQESTNSWIFYNQNYIKIPIAKTGIYQIEKSKIKEYGLDPNKKLGLYKKGKQVSIANNSDNIQFFGEINDGKADSILYRPTNAQAHQNYSLYTDTTYYFLTNLPENVSENNISELKNSNNLTPDYHFPYTETKWLTSEYTHNDATGPAPNIRTSYFVAGASFTGPMITGSKKFYIKPELKDICNGCNNNNPKINLLFNGRAEGLRSINCTYQKISESLDITGFNYKSLSLELPNILDIKDSVAMYMSSGNRFSLSMYELTYERNLNIRKGEDYVLNMAKKTINLEFSKASSELNSTFYDISSIYNIKKIIPSRTINDKVQLDLKGTNILYVSSEVLVPEKMVKKVFEKSSNKNADFLIITHPILLESANAYKTYRASIEGGGHKVALFNIKELADEYSYGEVNPLSIRNFFEDYIKNHDPKNLFLIGRGMNIYLSRYDKSDYRNFVPSYGYPASDLLLTADFKNKDLPRIATGRIPALTNEEVYNYLEKIKIKEANPRSVREKNILHLSGGKSDGERYTLKNIMTNIETISNNGIYGSETKTFNKNTNEYVVKIDISEDVNKGLSLITFLGHSGYDFTDMNIGFVTDPSYGYLENENYPVMFYNGCQFANSFNTYNTQADNWLMTKKRGAAAIISTSTYSYLSTFTLTMPNFYKYLFEVNPVATVGENVNNFTNIVLDKYYNNVSVLVGIHQHIILGDPSVKVFSIEKPDYTLDKEFISEFVSSNLESNEIKVDLPVYNLGIYEAGQKLQVFLTQVDNNGRKETTKYELEAPKVSNSISIDLKKIENLKLYQFEIVTGANSAEINKENNTLILDNSGSAASIDSENPVIQVYLNDGVPGFNSVVSPNPKISVYLEDNLEVNQTYGKAKVKIFIQSVELNSIPTEVDIPDSNITYVDNKLYVNYQFKDLSEGTYVVFVSATDANNNPSSLEYTRIQFIVSSNNTEKINNKLYFGPNPTTNCLNLKLFRTSENEENFNLKIIQSNGTIIDELEIKNNANYKWCFPNDSNTGVYYYKIIDKNHSSIDSGKILLLK